MFYTLFGKRYKEFLQKLIRIHFDTESQEVRTNFSFEIKIFLCQFSDYSSNLILTTYEQEKEEIINYQFLLIQLIIIRIKKIIRCVIKAYF